MNKTAGRQHDKLKKNAERYMFVSSRVFLRLGGYCFEKKIGSLVSCLSIYKSSPQACPNRVELSPPSTSPGNKEEKEVHI